MKGPFNSIKRREALVEHLISEGILKSPEVRSAFLSVPREEFIPMSFLRDAYSDRPLPIGKGQTISAPHMVAIMAEELKLHPGHRVLEIGGGSGYHAAIVARLVGPKGKVTSVEVIEELAARAREALGRASIENVEMVLGDGSVGYPGNAPYDRIYYTCAAPFVPEKVFKQLDKNGILLSVEGGPYSTQKLIRYENGPDGVRSGRTITYCIFVPLIGELGQGSRSSSENDSP